MKEEVAKQWLKKELEHQKPTLNSLEQVKDTLERKSQLEREAEELSDYWKDELARSERRADSLEEELQKQMLA